MAETIFDSTRANDALTRFAFTPNELTDEDVALCSLINPSLGERVLARKRGMIEPKSEQDNLPVTFGFVQELLCDVIVPKFSAYRFQINELEARIKELEQRPTLRYLGTWSEHTQYNAGDMVTSSGSMWHAKESTRAKPGDSSPASRAWTLAVKRGADGRDAR